MTNDGLQPPGALTPREQLSKLSEASLLISESLDIETVLREVVQSARSLTCAGTCGIVTTDASGEPEDFITSGFSNEEHQRIFTLPYGLDIWEHIRQVTSPLRIANLATHLGSLGLPEDPMLARSFLSVQVRHRAEQVGTLLLADKEGGKEFTVEDEEILILFASQAGAAIVTARKFLDEKRARTDMEALVDTSPVGVVVFNVQSGRAVYVNQESRRIVGDLSIPGRSAEELLNVLKVIRADGREILLEDFPLEQALLETSTIRAEEIVLAVPDGRKVTTLINATPIQSSTGEVESVVVTMQDMTSLEEQERLRAEFMGMVSHELRAPLTSVKGCTTTLLDASSVALTDEVVQFIHIIDDQTEHMLKLIGDLLDAAHIETGTLSVRTQPVELAAIVDQAA